MQSVSEPFVWILRCALGHCFAEGGVWWNLSRHLFFFSSPGALELKQPQNITVQPYSAVCMRCLSFNAFPFSCNTCQRHIWSKHSVWHQPDHSTCVKSEFKLPSASCKHFMQPFPEPADLSAQSWRDCYLSERNLPKCRELQDCNFQRASPIH